jgi:hypothetical protein
MINPHPVKRKKALERDEVALDARRSEGYAPQKPIQ